MRTLPTLFCLVAFVGAQGLQFTDVTAAAGITWTQVDANPQKAGAGAAWLDYDNDGWQDMFLAGGTGPVALYRNLGNGTFADVSATVGVTTIPAWEYAMGSAAADYDNDGDTDIFVCFAGANRLYRNDGGIFSEIAASAGVQDPLRWAGDAAWGDYDGDGDLDLYVGNFVQSSNYPNHTPWPNALYRNDGNDTFTDVTALCGVAGAGTTWAVSFTDYDDDGDQDIWVANDFGPHIEPNQLFRNDGPGATPGSWTFTDVSTSSGGGVAMYAMGIAAGDFDRDLDLDYYFTNVGANVLLRNDGASGFVDVAGATGTDFTWHPLYPNIAVNFSWGAGFYDFDQDGWLDLFSSNGYGGDAAPLFQNAATTPNALFHHNGSSLTFSEVATAAGVDDEGLGRGAAFCDYDKDGDVDILQVNIATTPLLYRNDTPNQGNWFRVTPVGSASNRDGYGARVQVDLPTYSLLREISPNESLQSTSERAAHFGVGSATTLDRVSMTWPSGISHQYHYVPANLAVSVAEPLVTVGAASSAPATVNQGTNLSVTLALENHTTAAHTAFHWLRFSAGGATVDIPAAPANVPASGTQTVTYVFPIPSNFLAGQPSLAVEMLWTVVDGTSADQWKADFVILP